MVGHVEPQELGLTYQKERAHVDHTKHYNYQPINILKSCVILCIDTQ